MTDNELPAGPGVYVVHFGRPVGHARNYLGSARNIAARIAVHRAGNGSPLVAEATRLGIEWYVSRIWETATEERARQVETGLKNRRDTPRFCPGCTPGTTRAADPRPAARRTARVHPPVRKTA